MSRRQQVRTARSSRTVRGLRKGISLIELLVVVVVVGVIVAFAAASFDDNVGAALEASIRHDVGTGKTAAWNWFYKYNNSFADMPHYGIDRGVTASPGNEIWLYNASGGRATVEVRAWNGVANRRCHETIGKPAIAIACEDGVY